MYESAKKSQEKLEEKRKSTPEGCTFRPQISKRAQSLKIPDSVDRSQHLYQNAMQIKQKVESLRKEFETEGCTFSPQITAKARKSAVANSTSRFDALYQSHKKTQERLEKVRKENELEGCTFSPAITAKAKRMSSPSPKLRAEKLYESFRGVQEEREKKKKELEVQGCTFKPQIIRRRPMSAPRQTQDASPTEQKSTRVQDRLLQFGQKKEVKLAAMRQEKEQKELEGIEFRPRINSARSPPRVRGESPFERLYQKDKSEVWATKMQQIEREVNKDLTFKPAIASRSLSPERKAIMGSAPVYERLYSEAEAKKEELRKLREEKELQELDGCTFRPAVGIPSPLNSPSDNTNSSRGDSSDDPVWERLNKNSRSNIGQLREEIRVRKELESCTFSPRINRPPSRPRSESKEPIWQRLSQQSKTQVEEEREKIKEMRDLEDCTFKPTIISRSKSPPRSTSGSDPNDSGESIHERLYRIAIENENLRKKEEIKAQRELEGCTFKPTINSIRSTTPARPRGESIHDRLHTTSTKSLQARQDDVRPLTERNPSPSKRTISPTRPLSARGPDTSSLTLVARTSSPRQVSPRKLRDSQPGSQNRQRRSSPTKSLRDATRKNSPTRTRLSKTISTLNGTHTTTPGQTTQDISLSTSSNASQTKEIENHPYDSKSEGPVHLSLPSPQTNGVGHVHFNETMGNDTFDTHISLQTNGISIDEENKDKGSSFVPSIELGQDVAPTDSSACSSENENLLQHNFDSPQILGFKETNNELECSDPQEVIV